MRKLESGKNCRRRRRRSRLSRNGRRLERNCWRNYSKKKLKKTNDIIAARGKGKGRLVVEGTDALIEKLVEATMHAESMPSGERSRFSSGLANGESRKRELSKDRMAGLHSVLKLMLLS